MIYENKTGIVCLVCGCDRKADPKKNYVHCEDCNALVEIEVEPKAKEEGYSDY